MIFNIGEYIKARRKELGITQKELASGLCSVMTLSRIERGEQTPQDYTLKSILQRLGLSGAELMLADSEDILLLHQLKFAIRQAVIQENHAKASEILRENKEWISKLEPLDRQTFETVAVLLKIQKHELGGEEALNQLKAAIKLTCPKYTKDNPPTLLTYEEILLLNNIALQYAHLGDMETAIKLFYHIKSFYDKCVCDIEEALRTQPMILYNLSKFLGQSKKYTECIGICEEGIKLAIETGKCSCLSQTYYNLSWSLYHRNNPGDKEASLCYMKLAYYSACTMKRKASIEKYAKVIFDRYNITIESL